MGINLESLLDEIGPCLSSTFVRALVEKGLSPVAARQRLSRAGGAIKKFTSLPFPYKAAFLYLQKDYNSSKFWDALHKAIVLHSPSYGPALGSLLQRGGVMPKAHFEIACGAPIRQKKHLSSETIYARFLAAKVTKEIHVPGVGNCVTLTDFMRTELADFPRVKARLIAENILLLAIRDWLRKLAIGSYDKIAIRDQVKEKQPTVGTFAWDLTGPSYLAPLVRWPSAPGEGKPKPGFVACDVLLSTTVNEYGLTPFLAKCSTLKNLKNVGACIQIFVAEGYTDGAFRAARSAGIIPATPESLFGTDVAKALVKLMDVLTQAAAGAVRLEVFDELFQRLGKIEGAAVNLRGALFEFVAADLARQIEGGPTTMNQIAVSDIGETAEIDVMVLKVRQSVLFIECKGYQPGGTVDDQYVERWLKSRIPIIEQYAARHPEIRQVQRRRYEFWTTGVLSEAAREMLEQAAARTTRYEIGFKDGAKVKEYAARHLPGSPLLKTLNEHFYEHPLAVAEKTAAARIARAEKAKNYRNNAGILATAEVPTALTEPDSLFTGKALPILLPK